MKPVVMVNDEESPAEAWARLAKREREHLAKYPDAFDRKGREQMAELYEKFAKEAREHDGQQSS